MDLTYKDKSVGIIRPSTHEDCLIVGSNLREREMQEIWGYNNSLPVEGVTNSFNTSVVKMTIEHDGKPIAMFGIMILNEVPTLWLMPTNDLEKIGRNFVRNTKEWINKMLEEYPTLVAYVNCLNEESERWMVYVGGQYIRKVFMGKDNAPFWEFKFRRQELATRDNIISIQDKISKMPDAMFGDCFPLKHKIIDGLYVREIFVPKGALFVSKLFKQDHASFLLLGELSILTEQGIMRVKAPFHMITKIGTKRVVYVHEDCVWITVHPNKNNLKTVEELEGEIIAKDYKELDEQENKFIEAFMEVK